VSLVLLLFFMMTASVATAAALVNTPEAYHGAQVAGDSRMFSINITRAADGTTLYALGQGDQAPAKDKGEVELTEAGLLNLLDERLKSEPESVNVNIKADRNLPYETVKRMVVALESRGRTIIRKTYAGVSERESR
jgi:biopolymer transport protein ExbD